MNTQTEMEKMMNQYLAHTYTDKNVLKVQKCRWKKRLLVEKDGLGSSATLINMLEYMIYQKNIYNKFIKFIMYGNNINMPYKTGKLKGLLTSAEIRKLIVSHNKLVKLSIPKGSNRDDLIKLIAKNGYRINHAKGVIEKGGGLLKQPPPAKKQTSFKSQVATTKPYVLSKKEKNEKIKTIEKIDKDKKENKNNKNLEEQIKDSWDQDELNYRKQYKTVVKKYSKNELVESDKAKLTKLFNDIKEDYITLEDGVIQEEMKSWSPIAKIMKNIKTIIASIDKKPPAKKVSVVKPAQSFNVKNTKVAQVKNKPPPPAKKVTPPKKDIYKISKELEKKIDYDEQIEERLKQLNDDVKSNKNVFGETGDSKQGVFMKLFTDIDKLGRGGVPKDFSSKSIKYAQSLLNIVYSNPPKDREGLIMPEEAFKGDGIFRSWRSYISDGSRSKRRKVMKEHNEVKKPVVKKPVVKKPVVKKPAVNSMNLEVGDTVVKYHDRYKKASYKHNKKLGMYAGDLPTDDISEGGIITKITSKKVFMKDKGETMIKNIIEIKKGNKSVDKPADKKPAVKKPPEKGEKFANSGLSLKEIMKKIDKLVIDMVKEITKIPKEDRDTKDKRELLYRIFKKRGYTFIETFDNGTREEFELIEDYFNENGFDKIENAMTLNIKKVLDKKPAVKKVSVKKPAPPPAVKKVSVKKPPIKKPPTEEVFTDSEEEEPIEITAMNHPLTKKLIEGVQSLRNKIKKDAKADPSKLTNMKVIVKMVRPIREFVRKLQSDNNVEFSSPIIVKFEDDLINNLVDDLKEIGGLKKPTTIKVNQLVKEEDDDDDE